MEGYSDAEINMGLNYLISPGLGEHMLCLDDPSVPLAARLRCVHACELLFRKLFLPRCSPHLSHRDEPGRSPLNAVATCGGISCRCTAAPGWTIAAPFIGRPWTSWRIILNFELIACAESALHGLGHWRRVFPEQVESLIDGFLTTHSRRPGRSC